MNTFIRWLIITIRDWTADFFAQIFGFFLFAIAGLAWIYFSSIYAAIAIVIIGIVLGGSMYGWIEGKRGENTHKNQS